MLDYNPFLERNFSTSNVSSYTYDRHYFPYHPSRTHKPGFLIPSQSQLPIVTGDIHSPYYRPGYKGAQKVRKSYIQNPFYKSHLLQNTDSYSSLYSSSVTSPNYNSYYGGKLYTSNVQVVDTDKGYTKYTSQNYYGDLNYEKIQRQNSRSLEKKESGYRNNNNNYDNSDQRGLLSRIADQNNISQSKKIQRGDSAIYKIYEKSPIEEDNPLNYDYPSFNNKIKNQKRQSIPSPTWPNQYQLLNEQYDSNFKKGNTYINISTQANNIRRQNTPQQIKYNGKTYNLLNTLPVDQF